MSYLSVIYNLLMGDIGGCQYNFVEMSKCHVRVLGKPEEANVLMKGPCKASQNRSCLYDHTDF
jgi:hypothetical protein